MLKDENSAFAQQILLENRIYDLLAALQIVGRIRKNQVKLLGNALQIEKNIGLHNKHILKSQLASRRTDKVEMDRIDLHRCHTTRSSRCELVADRARAGEEIEDVALLEIDHIGQYVEEILLGKVSGGTCAEVLGRIDCSPSVFAAYYSHF